MGGRGGIETLGGMEWGGDVRFVVAGGEEVGWIGDGIKEH